METLFSTLNLTQETLKNLDDLNFTQMTPIQEKSLPLILEGKDVIGQAKTGSGKTLAFGLNLLEKLDIQNKATQGLILCPTRELAEQVAIELRNLARHKSNCKILTICGGTIQFHQERSLEYGAHIIVGTPGRVLRLLKEDYIHLDHTKHFILDEADRMLDMGFIDDIRSIEQYIPRDRQTLLFSATFPEYIVQLSDRMQKDATLVKTDTSYNVSAIKQHFYEVESHKAKDPALLQVLAHYQPKRFLIFCKTKNLVDSVTKFLKRNGIYAEGVHGDHDQRDRIKSLEKFSNYSLSGLVATDVAARGLDIKDLPFVINYDLTHEAEVYIHRIGRTGRAGKTGEAVSFYIDTNYSKVQDIEELLEIEYPTEQLEDLTSDGEYRLEPEMKTLFISGGKKDKLRPGDIVGALVGVAGISSEDIGDIKIQKIMSFVAVKAELAEGIIEKLYGEKIKNRKFKVGLA